MGKSLESSKGSVWALFLTTHAVVLEAIESRLSAAGLPALTWYDVLWALERGKDERARMHELAEKTVLSRSNLTRLIDRLEDARLVKRERAENDRRGAFAVLTSEGKAMRKKMWPVYERCIEAYFEAQVSASEAQTLAAVLQRIQGAAQAGHEVN